MSQYYEVAKGARRFLYPERLDAPKSWINNHDDSIVRLDMISELRVLRCAYKSYGYQDHFTWTPIDEWVIVGLNRIPLSSAKTEEDARNKMISIAENLVNPTQGKEYNHHDW